MNVIVKRPSDCSEGELQDFVAFILAGGEVIASGLTERVNAAESLVMLTVDGCLTGIGAIKRPQLTHRQSVSRKSGVSLEPSDFPYELGWIFVLPSARGQGLSRYIVEAALSSVVGSGVFATSRTDNTAMHRSLERFSFVRSRTYRSDRGDYQLQLFVRPST